MPSVYPIEKLPPAARGHFRHMAKRDEAVWVKFLGRRAGDFLAFAYDVALGGRIVEFPGMTPEERLGWQYATALKIDAVAYQADLIWVIEVRPEATVSALGAALTYTLVARRDDVFDLPILPAIVCETMQPDVKWACGELGIHVEEVP